MTAAPAWTPEALKALFAFYVEAGVDAAVSEAPVDRLNAPEPEPWRPSAAPAAPPPSPPRRPAAAPAAPARAAPTPAAAPPAGSDAVMAAREAASSARTLDELKATLARFEGCSLRFTARSLVFADGDPQARVMFVGEAPGQEEDAQGLPFVGRSGQLFNRMLNAIGVERRQVYVANAIYWRPPKNRKPTPQETEICRPFVARQIALVDPDLLVLLGGVSTGQLLRTNEGILKLRGQWRDYDARTRMIPALATLHPAYLLRQPLQKRLAWRDFLALKARLAALPE